MDKKILALKSYFKNLYTDDIYLQSKIEIINNNKIVINANKEGFLVLIEELINLCVNAEPGYHYHLDETGMVNKCDIPVVLQFSPHNDI